jgi:hypothetical protein
MIVAPLMPAALSAALILSQGCRSTDLMLHDCPRVGPALTPAPSVASGALTLAHLFLMPVLAAVAAALE